MKQLSAASDLIGLIPAGATVVVHSGCGEPLAFTDALAAAADRLEDVTIITMMPMGRSPYGEVRSPNIKVETFFPGRGLRKAAERGDVRLRRHDLRDLPSLFETGQIKADLLLLQLSDPDAEGRHSLGVSLDYMPAVLAQEPLVAALINPAYPRVGGSGWVTPHKIDFALEASAPVQTIVSHETEDEASQLIADHLASLVRDGDVLQLGIGALPDAVARRLDHCRDLGIHSGIVTDAIVPLIEAGVITNAEKAEHRGRCVATMAGGSELFYRYLHDHPGFSFQPCSYTHDLHVLTAIPRLTAINSALEVDLEGRVNAETLDGRLVSSVGGLANFARGASHAPGGRSIIALRATSRGGETSRVRTRLDPRKRATLEPDETDIVVTEFGIAHLTGTSAADRKRALAAISHPEFRRELGR